MDIDRIDELCRKLSHSRLEIRSRALDNILFKLDKGLITITGISCCQNVLIGGIYDALVYIIDNDNNNNEANTDSWKVSFPPTLKNKHFISLLSVIKYIGTMSNLSDDVLDKLSKILERLYSLIATHEMDSTVKDSITSAISSLSNLNSDKSKQKDINLVDEDYSLSLFSQRIHKIKTEFIPSNDEYNELLKTSSFSGAGGILYSSFSYSGWKFPCLAITEIDEKYLFDVEVKLKLGHPGCEGALWALLADFPPHILIQRTGILQQVLDIVGSVFFHDTDMILSVGITPSSAMKWLEKLLKKCIEGYLIQMDGSASSAIPEPLASDNDNPSLAAQMAKAIYSMRIPLHSSGNSFDEISLGASVLSYEQRKIKNLGTVKPPLPPTPSVSGFAFSCCAACLPVIQTKDLSLCTSVLSMLLSALPYIKDPSLHDDLTAMDCHRIQHLMSRVEQMIKFFGDSLSFKYVFYSANTKNVSIDEMERASFDALLVRVVIEIISLVPFDNISNGGSRDSSSKIVFGSNTIDFIKKVVIMTVHDPYLDMKLFTNVDVLKKALSAVHASSFSQIKYTESILSTHTTMNVNIEELIRIRQDLYADPDVKREKEIKIIDDLVNDALAISCLLDDDLSMGLDLSGMGLIKILSLVVFVSYNSHFADYDYDAIMPVILRIVSCGNLKSKFEFIDILAYFSSDEKSRSVGSFPEIDNLLFALGLGSSELKSSLTHALSNSNFVYSVLMYGILNNIDVKDTLSNQGISGSVFLLNIIFENILQSSQETMLINWCNSLCPLKVIQWKVEMGCGLGSTIMEGYVQALPSAISTFIEQLEDVCAAADPDATPFPNANEQYNKALMLGLFSLSPTIRNRCCLTLQGLGLGLNTQNYRLISSLNTNSTFPTFGEISPSIPLAVEKVVKSSNSFNSFKFIDLKKLGDIAFGTENIQTTIAVVKSVNPIATSNPSMNPISIDASIRISALRQMQEVLTENLLSMQSKQAKVTSSNSSPNLTVALTLEYDWCVALLSLTLILLRDVRLRLDCSNGAANNNADLVTLCVEALNMIRLLMLTIPTLKRKIRLTVSEEAELGMGLGLGLSVQPLLSIMTNHNPNPNADPNEYEIKAWARLQLTVAHLLYLLVADCEGWKIDSNTPNDFQQIFIATHSSNSNQFTIPSFLFAFMNDIENVNSSLNCNSNPSPTYGTLSCICKNSNNSNISKDVIQSALDQSPTLSSDTLTNIIFSIQDSLDEISNQNGDNNASYRSCLNLLNSVTITLPLTLSLTPGLLVSNSMSLMLGIILSKAPKNHEDFMTLNLALEYITNCLNAVYAGLSLNNGEILPDEQSFIYDIVSLLNKTGPNPLIGILADSSPTSYFKSFLYHNPGSNPNIATITLPLTQSDMINMQNIFSQTQYRVLEMIKCVTSICVAMNSDRADNPNLNSLPIEFDYGITSTLVRIITSENFTSDLRNLAASGVEGIVTYKGRWDIDSREGLGIGLGLEFEFNIFNDIAANISYNTPSKSSIDQMLRIVKLLRVPDSLIGSGIVINTLRILTLYLKYMLSSGEGLGLGLDWKWLVKLCYDRRAEVRAVCLEVIDLILTIENTIDNPRFNLQPTLNNDEESGEGISWPPYDTLKLIIVDKNEAGSVRVMASKVLVKHCHPSGSSGLIGQIVMALYDTLDLSSPRANVSSIRESLGIVTLLLSSTSSSSEALKCLVSMKVLPQIISILNPNFPALMQQLAKSRVGLSSSDKVLHNYGWGLLWHEYLKENEQNLVLSFASVAKGIVLLSKEAVDGGNYFTQCVLLTPVIPNAIVAMSNLTNSLSRNYTSFNYAYSSLADLVTQAISLQIIDQKKVVNLGKSNSQAAPTTLIESIAYQLEFAGALVQESVDVGVEVSQSVAFLITSTTRLLCLTLSVEFWKSAVEGKDGSRSMKSIILSALITLKSLLSASVQSVNTTALSLQVDMATSLILQKWIRSDVSVIDEDNDESFYSYLVISNIRKINECCDNITNAGQTNSTIAEMKSSLKTLRKKMGRDQLDTSRNKVRGYTYNQSTNDISSSPKSVVISDSDRLVLWQSLVVLANSLADSPKLRELASELDLAFSLSRLFRFCSYWASSSGPTTLHEATWYPTNSNLASAVLSLALAFCHCSDGNKNILATTGELTLSVTTQTNRLKGSTETSKGKVIHQLLSMGLSKGLILPFRCLALELLGVTVSSLQPNPVLQKMCLTSTLVAALRKSLHSSSSDPDILVFLLDAFTSIITSKNTKEIHSSTSVIKENLDDIGLNVHSTEMSIPALFQWIWDVSSNLSPTLAASLLRCVGRMGNPIASLPLTPNNGHEALYKRLLSNVTDQDTLTIVTTACNSDNIVLQEVGMMALWSILHNSEQARAHFKKSGLNITITSVNANTRSRIALNLLMN